MVLMDTVQVALRIRPLVDSERERGCVSCLDTMPGEPQVQVKGLPFTYNHVFPPEVGQNAFYDAAVANLVKQLFKGYNVTILAYGQTGSGKTYSMGTCYTGRREEEGGCSAGVIPLAVTDIFSMVEAHRDEYSFKVTVSFMELYQEQLYDLLSNKPRDQTVIDIREDNRGIILPGLTEKKVTSVQETIDCLIRGSSGRATGATAMNAQSSRSHAIFTIQILQECKQDSNKTTTSKFHLVDLAGSERSKKTKATGNRFKEGVKINQGLLALGNVISALGDENNRGYISYRESKLTRLLQDSLGGNSMTLMVACVSPADYNLEETLSTLRYADRARHIRNKPIVNQDAKAAEINRLNNLVQQLRLQLLNQGGELPQNFTNLVDELNKEKQKNSDLTEKYEAVVQKNKNLSNMLQQALMDHTHMCEKAILAEASKDKIEKKLAELAEECNNTISNLKGLDKTDISIRDDALRDMCEIRNKLGDINSEHQKCGQLIQQLIHEESPDLKTNGDMQGDEYNIGTPSELDESDFNEKQETHTNEQISRNNELQNLLKSMALKKSLAEKLQSNNQDLTVYSESVKECEAKISALEAEREDLMSQLKSKIKVDPKTVDERQKKIQGLESEIAGLRKKCLQQAKLIKMKEENELKITSLSKEIRDMKAAKVKLVRTMRAESDEFRKWKLQHEKRLAALLSQERKQQNAIIKMENKYTKQQNVMKRKMEEAVATSKRLKEAMERRCMPGKAREQQAAGRSEAVQHWVERELELASSLAAAQCTLEGLLEDRGSLAHQLEEARTEGASPTKLASLEEDVARRTTQIADMQEKIMASDQEMKAKPKWEGIQSMVEAKLALRCLFEAATEARREVQAGQSRQTQEEAREEEVRRAHREALQRLGQCELQLKAVHHRHRKELAQVERQFEEKVCTLINLGMEGDNKTTESQMNERIAFIQEAYEKAIEAKTVLIEENERLHKELLESKRGQQQPKPRAKAGGKQKVIKTIVSFSDDEEEELEDDDNDPDWAESPHPRRTFTRRNMSNEEGVAVKRSSDGQPKCSCKGNCSQRLCSCRKLQAACGPRCKCNTLLCINKHTHNPQQPDGDSPNMMDNGSSSDKENTSTELITPPAKQDDTHIFKAPKLENGSMLLNVTNKVKKNKSFFYGEGQLIKIPTKHLSTQM